MKPILLAMQSDLVSVLAQRTSSKRQLIWLLLGVSILCAQLVKAGLPADILVSTLPPAGSEISFSIDKARLRVFTDSTCALDWHGALNATWQIPDRAAFDLSPKFCRWMATRFVVPGTVGDGLIDDWLAEVGYHGQSTLYLMEQDSLVYEGRMGNDLPLNARAYPHIWSDGYQNVSPLKLRPGTEYTLLVHYANPHGASLYGTNDLLAVTFWDARRLDQQARFHLVASGLMIGGLLLLLLYQVAQWTVYRTELDATYCMMLLGLLAYVSYDDSLFHAAFADSVVREVWLYVTGSLGLMGFFRFAQLTLRNVAFQPQRDRLLGILVLIEAVKAPAFLVLTYLAIDGPAWVRAAEAVIPETFRILLLVALCVFAYAVLSHFRAHRDRATWAFTLGNLVLVISVMVVVLRAYMLPYADNPVMGAYLAFIDKPFKYIIEIGIVVMALFFAFAVAIVTKDRESRLERNFNRRLAEVRMEALRSQMNPHFLFNGLNSIKLFVIDNEPRIAGDYLTRFAHLIRLVLENSKSNLVTLARELETLDLYMRMESLRFSEKFTYEIAVDPAIDCDFVYLPPTIIQPYVENAIWHGLLHRDLPGGHLSIRVETGLRDRLKLTIEDNGVGREESTRRRNDSSTRHKSMGMQITAERISLLRQLYGFVAEVKVEDLVDAMSKPSGTRVTIDMVPAQSSGESATEIYPQRRDKPLAANSVS